jgi:hypothetical protein
MDRSSGFGRLPQLDVMGMASGAGVATALAQELYGAADRFPASAFDSAVRPLRPANRNVAASTGAARRGSAPCPPAGHVA